MGLFNKLFSKQSSKPNESETKKADNVIYANVIDEDGVSHDVPENGAIASNDKEHCFVCDSDYYHLWLGCYFLKKESENYKKPIYFKKINDLKTKNTCGTCFDYVTSDNYVEWDFKE